MTSPKNTLGAAIAAVHARQVFDSRGRPTVEVDVLTEAGTTGRAAVPSGASTGTHEAWELRDGDAPYAGLGVTTAVAHVNDEIAAALKGSDVTDQRGIDALLTELDGTDNLQRLGANAILGTSLAVSRAAAQVQGLPLHRWLMSLAGTTEATMPMPMVNILSGGLHAGRGMDVQDFLAVPASATSIDEALALVGQIRSAAAEVMRERGLTTLLADEGGLSPGLETGRDALQLMVDATERAGLVPGRDIVIAIDVAAHSLWDPKRGAYHLAREGRYLSTDEMIDMICDWVNDFPVVSVEDALDEEDWAGWTVLTGRLGERINLIGDDLFTTNRQRLGRGIETGAANGVLVKVNQNGTLSGTLDVVAAAREAGYVPVVSARSGETEDPYISDLAVATAAGQIKVGSVRCSDRLSKYNQLVRIAEDTTLPFAGMAGYPYFRADAHLVP
ncbi:phosphopyruvate hydratase [Nocardioides sp. NPDC127514]|uniref:phosphopyruvate hydratase n=1 Tax=unclassified Nocardioides TaxID=2615069 RepID=UPI00332D2191